MNIRIINGPNLNMLGIREPAIYGRTTYDDLCTLIGRHAEETGVNITLLQSNHEGDLVDYIQQAYGVDDAIIINPGAYTHTSVEVHISKVEEREDFRQISYIRQACVRTITGHGIAGYTEAMDYLKENYGA